MTSIAAGGASSGVSAGAADGAREGAARARRSVWLALPRSHHLDRSAPMKSGKVAVVGAGNMGSGIAQKIATESIPVTLIDKSRELAEAGKQPIDAMLVEGLERGIFTGDQVDGILGCITARADVSAAANANLV